MPQDIQHQIRHAIIPMVDW